MTDRSPRDDAGVPDHKPRPLVDLLLGIVIPSAILMKLSGDEALGASGALVVALLFPIGWWLYERLHYRKFNFIAALGLISVLLTGGIGLMELDPQWLAIKEAAIPAILGIAVLISTLTPYPLLKAMLYNPTVVDTAKIQERLAERHNEALFERRLLWSSYMLAGTFFFSAVMNYILAKWIVTSPSGSSAFNEELGRMTLLSYPVIALPSMAMMMAIMVLIWRTIRQLTDLTLEDIFDLDEDGDEGKERR